MSPHSERQDNQRLPDSGAEYRQRERSSEMFYSVSCTNGLVRPNCTSFVKVRLSWSDTQDVGHLRIDAYKRAILPI